MLHTYSLSELHLALQKKQFSSTELTQYFLNRIHKASALNAFISIDIENALAQAARADQRIAKHETNALTGIPIAHKDNFCTRDLPTTCASNMLSNFHPPYDATIVKNLADNGCVLLGKTNMDEFAMGSSNETSFYGPVRNPWNTDCVPGGSSGGSAAAVAARLVPFATGTDTGGSIRQPAAFCGVSGLKPSYGLVSRYGMVSYGSSLDQAGLIAPSAEDIAVALPIMAGFDEQDSTSIRTKIPNYLETLNESIQSKKIGIPNCFFHPEVDPAIKAAITTALTVLEQAGATIVELDLKLYDSWLPCYYTLACAEASSNLARFDGIRFGHRAKESANIRELVTQSRTQGFGSEVKRRILTGTYVLSAEHFDTYYVHAQKIRQMISQELQSALSQVDILLGPTTLSCAYPLNHREYNPIQHQLSDMFTVAANLAGLPALSIPVGFHQGLPIGMQCIGPYFGEALLLQIAHHYQSATDWHTKIPEAFASDLLGASS